MMLIMQANSAYPSAEARQDSPRSGKYERSEAGFSSLMSDRRADPVPHSPPDSKAPQSKRDAGGEPGLSADDEQKLTEVNGENAASYIISLLTRQTQSDDPPVEEEDQSASPLPQAPISGASEAGTDPIVSILEGNDPDMDTIPPHDSGETARMPQIARSPEANAADEGQPPAAGDMLCPLENENDTPADFGPSDKYAGIPEKTPAEIPEQAPAEVPARIAAQDPAERKDTKPADPTFLDTRDTQALSQEYGVDSGSAETDEKGSRQDRPSLAQRELPTQQVVDVSPERAVSSTQLQQPLLDSEPVTAAAEGVNKNPDAPVRTSELFDMMIQKIELSKNSGTNQLEIQLKPEHLGKVSIQLSMSDNGLTAKINADSMEVRSLINSQISHLTESLSEKGIKVTNIEVAYSGVSEHAFSQSRNKGGTREEEQSRLRIQRLQRLNGYAAPEVTGWGEPGTVIVGIGTSSVEYRA